MLSAEAAEADVPHVISLKCSRRKSPPTMNKENDMKKSFLTVICLLSVMALSACGDNASNGTAENNAVTLQTASLL